jgi:hypothetical protein
MGLTQIVWGIAGAATTMAVRAAARRAMHDEHGAPRLPNAMRGDLSFSMMVLLAGGAGVMLALGDVLRQRRKQIAQTAAA